MRPPLKRRALPQHLKLHNPELQHPKPQRPKLQRPKLQRPRLLPLSVARRMLARLLQSFQTKALSLKNFLWSQGPSRRVFPGRPLIRLTPIRAERPLSALPLMMSWSLIPPRFGVRRKTCSGGFLALKDLAWARQPKRQVVVTAVAVAFLSVTSGKSSTLAVPGPPIRAQSLSRRLMA